MPKFLISITWFCFLTQSSGLAQTATIDTSTVSTGKLFLESDLSNQSSNLDQRLRSYLETPTVAERLWGCDILFGLPTGLRVMGVLNGAPIESAWRLEGFIGTYLIVLPTAGVGVRRSFVYDVSESSQMILAPGVGAYAMYIPSITFFDTSSRPQIAGIVTTDVDWGMQHISKNGSIREYGWKLGLGAAIGERRVTPVPIVSYYFSWRF